MILALSLQVTGFSLTDNNKRNKKQKMRQRQHCVGRESNPGQLLGKQLCSPLYNRRVGRLSIWQFCFHGPLCVCLRIMANGLQTWREYKIWNAIIRLKLVVTTFFFYLRNLLLLTFNIIGHRRTWINMEAVGILETSVISFSCYHKFSLIFNNYLSWISKVAFH